MTLKPLQIVRTTAEVRSDNGAVPSGTRTQVVSIIDSNYVSVKIADPTLSNDRQGDRLTVALSALAVTSRGRPRKVTVAA
jgi:hypothetical protein